MQDRVPLYPGRVKLVPVEGQENTYDMVRADQPTQAGTPLSKANLLKDTTAALFGLGATAVPDDVLGWIGKYNEYWWRLLHGEAYSYTKYVEKKSSVATSTHPATSSIYFVAGYSKAKKTNTIQYANSITIDPASGAVSLNSPSSLTLTGYEWPDTKESYNQLVSISPCYVKGLIGHEDSIYYIPSSPTLGQGGETFTYYGNSDGHDLSLNINSTASPAASVVTSEAQIIQVPAGETTYEHSTDRNAYPDSGTVDGITYTYLGRPFEKFPTMPQIETGSYIGTGTYGDSSPNRLTFEFMPKFVQIRTDDMYGAYVFTDMTLVRGVKTTVASRWYHVYDMDDAMLTMGSGSGSNSVKNNVTWGNTFVEFYALSSSVSGTRDWFQMNASGRTYHYIAIG